MCFRPTILTLMILFVLVCVVFDGWRLRRSGVRASCGRCPHYWKNSVLFLRPSGAFNAVSPIKHRVPILNAFTPSLWQIITA